MPVGPGIWLLTALAGLLAAPDVSRAAGPDRPALADVIAVEVRGRPGAYQLHVTVRSPDLDCSRYANWWEVLRPDGTLVYRRVLKHSHAGEQPFTRAGGPVPIDDDEVVVVRAHMHPSGYGGASHRGSPKSGFSAWKAMPGDFAADLARADPQPGECWY